MARKDPSESTSFKGLPELGDFGGGIKRGQATFPPVAIACSGVIEAADAENPA